VSYRIDYSVAALTFPSRPTGPTGAPSIQFAFLGCYQQTCTKQQVPTGLLPCFYGFDNATIFGGYIQTVQGNANFNIDAQCANICINRYGANYFGTINSGASTTGDCYCGSSITSGTALFTNCVACNGQAVGLCGSSSQSSIAVFARAFQSSAGNRNGNSFISSPQVQQRYRFWMVLCVVDYSSPFVSIV
jgi:hypothetical protein